MLQIFLEFLSRHKSPINRVGGVGFEGEGPARLVNFATYQSWGASKYECIFIVMMMLWSLNKCFLAVTWKQACVITTKLRQSESLSFAVRV